MELTLAMIKPDAMAANNAGKIIDFILQAGLKLSAIKLVQMDAKMAGDFYAVHRERPFYRPLVEFMSSGPILVMALKGNNAILRWRELMGPTNPENAPEGTIRNIFGTDTRRNATHGSDAPETAEQEISFFFSRNELIN